MVSWEDVARDAQKHRDSTIDAIEPPLPLLPSDISHNVIDIPRQTLSQEEIQITETPILRLLQLLKTGEVTATAVTNAFLRRAAVAQKLVNPYQQFRGESTFDSRGRSTVSSSFHRSKLLLALKSSTNNVSAKGPWDLCTASLLA